jgi:hypothetical protein
MPRPGYVSITVTATTQRQLQQRSYRTAIDTGRRVTIAQIIEALDQLADRHTDELVQILNETSQQTH